jgi:hypothetical protein
MQDEVLTAIPGSVGQEVRWFASGPGLGVVHVRQVEVVDSGHAFPFANSVGYKTGPPSRFSIS